MKQLGMLLGLVLLLSFSEAHAATFETSVTKTIYDGAVLHPVGRWVSDDELDISFLVRLEDFEEVDPKSLRYEYEEDTFRLFYKIVTVEHSPDAPVALCYSRRVITYKIKGMPHQAYMAHVVDPNAPSLLPLPIIPFGPHPDIPDVLKVSSLDGGKKLLLDGKAIALDALKARIKAAFVYQTPIWIYTDSEGGMDIVDYAIEQQVPYAIAEKPDFSDVIAMLQKE